VVFPAMAEAKRPIEPSQPTVMTRNLYLGALLDPAIAAPDAPSAYTAIGDIYKHVQDMNFNARAELLANEIEANDPDLIGLQEVTHWMRDDVVDGPTTQATETVYDYLDLLMKELDSRGLNYSVAVSQNEADLEFPADTSGDGSPDFDARMLMRDVILAKEGVKVTATGHGNYSSNAFASTAAFGTVTILRGYTWADVRINNTDARGKKFRFVNTHLESFSAYFRNAQAQELVGGSGVTAVARPIILVGDLNSDPDDPSSSTPPDLPTPNAAAYNSVIAGGFSDYGLEVNTCCWGEDIRDAPPSAFTSRIDHVLGKGAVSELSSTLIGNDPANRTGTGLWPTDHGGVVGQLLVGATP
jgi:endonuclease/exonuclease/phosphatase family metal-dependent hydrolase